ncbi:hypothetical protein HF086_015256 [Spodoptera exigua]|uniref:Uncharacterized protein n=1 Tax=Spodoptera exigua TaxID=7107 RepID=A0A922SGC9_SPOEX|nr:hypothetical protein HF086_015256 [Spodoptera exigua]
MKQETNYIVLHRGMLLSVEAKAPPGKEFIWANSTSLRLNLLAWAGRCPVTAWELALRPATGGAWQSILTDGEAVSGGAGGGGGVVRGALWRSGLLPALLGGALAALLLALAVVVVGRRRRAASCLRRERSLHQLCQPHPQLYTTEPSKRNGKTMTPPDGESAHPYFSRYYYLSKISKLLKFYGILHWGSQFTFKVNLYDTRRCTVATDQHENLCFMFTM